MTENGPKLYPCNKFAARISRRQCLENMKKALQGRPGYRNTCLSVDAQGGITRVCRTGKHALAELKSSLENEKKVTGASGPCRNCTRRAHRLTKGLCPACYKYIGQPEKLQKVRERFLAKSRRGSRKAPSPAALPASSIPAPPIFIEPTTIALWEQYEADQEKCAQAHE
jgi:hypothetical protein